MRKGFSLVEVIVSVMLISVVIGSLLQMKTNNISYLEKFKLSQEENSYICLALQKTTNLEYKKIYLKDVVDFGVDDIRRKFKDIKIELKQEEGEEIELPYNDYVQTAQVIKSKYTLNDKISKSFYEFKLNYE